ncbi:NAD(P)(+)--arginine ADP-ribosyltransferase 2-like protein [Labeo rohita]|uniref:NAD(P)(+)--arginine ADP-ribosyltransferase n=1 Tax=Labeo rohita TaxID=84645 RepID=A0A498LXS2_LABRO|nr:NAD(P)(+)--arginine ADP-ribosyltransferase 2-like protein [Labeo rohita]
MLLMIEALLLISAALQDRAAVADGKTLPLDMALNSVDDLYVGCKKNMAYRVETELLKNELSNSDFKEAWQKAEEDHKPPEDNLKEIHSVAIYAYSDIDLHDIFNKAVRSGKEKYKNKTYSWYSLQFLLTEAIQILKETQNGCKSTYRGTRNTFDQNVLNNQVRFGQFASSSFDQTQAEEFGTKSCFEITTCEGANVTKYSALPIEKEVLIPPYEVFNVTEVKTRNVQEDLWCETVFVLERYLLERGDSDMLSAPAISSPGFSISIAGGCNSGISIPEGSGRETV